MNRRSLVVAGTIWTVSLGAALSIRKLRAGSSEPAFPGAFVPVAGSIYGLQATWTSDLGTPWQLAQLAGKYLIVALIFTRCPGICPTLVKQLLGLARRMSENVRAHTHFALFSVDPQHDTPAVLHAYRQRMGLDAGQWTLGTAAIDAVRELGATLGFAFSEERDGLPTHSKLVTLLDRAGRPMLQRADIGVDPELLTRTIEAALLAEGER
jgi:protein SCO1